MTVINNTHFLRPRGLPATVARRIVDQAAFSADVGRITALNTTALFAMTENCLRNLPHVDEALPSADADLQLVLVPELWERIQPGVRGPLRRISTSLAEYDPNRPSSLARLLSAPIRRRLEVRASELRQAIARAASFDTKSLAEWTRFSIAGSRASSHHAPEDFVYPPAFTYRLVPAIVQRAMTLSGLQGARTPAPDDPPLEEFF